MPMLAMPAERRLRLERDGADADASALLGELEAQLLGRGGVGPVDMRLQDMVLRRGVFDTVQTRLGGLAAGTASNGCKG
jgi:hypothetical protein